jgi:hypothetical protein
MLLLSGTQSLRRFPEKENTFQEKRKAPEREDERDSTKFGPKSTERSHQGPNIARLGGDGIPDRRQSFP